MGAECAGNRFCSIGVYYQPQQQQQHHADKRSCCPKHFRRVCVPGSVERYDRWVAPRQLCLVHCACTLWSCWDADPFLWNCCARSKVRQQGRSRRPPSAGSGQEHVCAAQDEAGAVPVATIHLYWVSESAAPAYRMRSKLASINSLCFLHGTLTSLLTPLCTFFCGVHVRTSQGDPGHVVRMVYTSNVSKQRWSRNAGDKTQILWTPTSSALDTTEHSARLLDAVEDDATSELPPFLIGIFRT